MSYEKMPVIVCSGRTPTEIGFSHGAQLKEQIAVGLESYYSGCAKNRIDMDMLRQWGEKYRGEVGAFAPHLAEEIDGIAAGAGRAAWELFVLNARVEVWSCTEDRIGASYAAVCCAGAGLLGQTCEFDLGRPSMQVILQIPRCDSLPQVLAVSEPGIVAKSGLNDAGVGVCFNRLGPRSSEVDIGVPAYCLLRVALSCESLVKADALLRAAPHHCACHILLADMIGQFRMLEFARGAVECANADPLSKNVSNDIPIEGSEWQVLPPTLVAHTGIYLHPRFAALTASSAHAAARHERTLQLARDHEQEAETADQQFQLVRRVLRDAQGIEEREGTLESGALSSLCRVILDLRSLQLHVSRGSASAQQDRKFSLMQASL